MDQKLSLIDSHCHLYYPDFEADWEQMLARASQNGVRGMVVVGADLASSRQAVELAVRYEQLYCTVGIHPHDVATATAATISEIKHLAQTTPKCVAIGEIGLDFYRDRAPRDPQRTVYGHFLQMALELDKPVVIHDRDAHQETLGQIKAAGVTKGVMHCFSGDSDFARQCLEQGLYISIPGTVTYPSNQQLRDVVQAMPMERLLLETDCPTCRRCHTGAGVTNRPIP